MEGVSLLEPCCGFRSGDLLGRACTSSPSARMVSSRDSTPATACWSNEPHLEVFDSCADEDISMRQMQLGHRAGCADIPHQPTSRVRCQMTLHDASLCRRHDVLYKRPIFDTCHCPRSSLKRSARVFINYIYRIQERLNPTYHCRS